MFREEPRTLLLLVVAFNDKVFGLDPRTGAQVWRCIIGPGGPVRVHVRGERVFAFGSDLVCLDLATGREIYRTGAVSRFSGGTLLVTDEFLFLGSGGEAAAVEAETGKLLWLERFSRQGLGAVALAIDGASTQADLQG